MKKGFTLIELLVVVLIIGILTAIALPQYQKAVEKARMTEAIMAVEKIAQAQQIYKMANGTYTRNIEELDTGYVGESVKYCGTIKGILTSNFRLMASNCAGEQVDIALVGRYKPDLIYSLSIRTTGRRVCNQYTGISNYEKQLCQAWAAGK